MTVVDPEPRHQLFERARQRAEWSIQELWVHALALGGSFSVFDVEAFLYGIIGLSPAQQDVLANALNDRLDDLYRAAAVPYLTTQSRPEPSAENPLTVLDELLDRTRQASSSGDAPPPRSAP